MNQITIENRQAPETVKPSDGPATEQKEKPMNPVMISATRENDQNRRLPAVIGVSMLLHIIVLALLGLIKTPAPLSVIELSMMTPVPPMVKAIPRPAVKPQNPVKPRPQVMAKSSAHAAKAPEIHNPDAAPAPTPTDAVLPDVTSSDGGVSAPVTSAEHVGTPDGSGTKGSIGNGLGKVQSFFSKQDYFNLVRSNIEANKIYPERARRRMIEGKVTVRFIIMTDGQVSSVAIVKHSGDMTIDKAALKAISDSAPFAQPPSDLFTGPLPMEITIAFKLI
jgi:protein TonB